MSVTDGTAPTSPLLPFTAHNVRLNDGSETIPGEVTLAKRALPQAVLRTLDFCFPDRAEGELSAVDLACLEGGYSALLASAGFRTLGIEGRPGNLARCQYVASGLSYGTRLRFECDDVRNLAGYGVFDVTFCSGLLYHLDQPMALLKLLAASTSKVLLLHTHFATDTVPERFAELSEMTSNEGVQGRWYPEHPEGSTTEEILDRRWASLDNAESFWVEKRYLLQGLRDVGFPIVYEQYDFLDNVVTDDYIQDYNSSFFVAIKAPLP